MHAGPPCAVAPRSGMMDAVGEGETRGPEKARKGAFPLSGAVALLALGTLATFTGFQVLLSVVPLYADAVGGGTSGAGLSTAAFMLSTVLTQVVMPRILGRFGYRRTVAAGLVFLGLPAFLYPLAGGVAWILAVTLARGIGFGIVTVVFAALVVELAPPGRRGEALGLFGIAITLPAIFCNPLGLWLVDAWGYAPVFVLGGLSPLLGLFAVAGLRAPPRNPAEGKGAGFLDGLRRGPLLRLFLLFTSATAAMGVVVTFLPLALPNTGLFSPAVALLLFGVASAGSRLWAGRFGDRRDTRLLLAPGLLASAAGMAALPQGGPTTLAGALLFGCGLGALQSSTLLLTMDRVGEDERGLGSTLWNVSFDAGTGTGAFAFGFIVGATGFTPAFYLSAAILLAALVLVAADHRRTRKTSP